MNLGHRPAWTSPGHHPDLDERISLAHCPILDESWPPFRFEEVLATVPIWMSLGHRPDLKKSWPPSRFEEVLANVLFLDLIVH
jgi:hypothetical protein